MKLSLGVFCALAFLSTACSEQRAAQSDRTEMRFDSASKILNIRCVSATAGYCRVLVESASRADRRLIAVPAGNSRDVLGIDRTSRACDLPKIVDEISCSWVPVSDLR